VGWRIVGMRVDGSIERLNQRRERLDVIHVVVGLHDAGDREPVDETEDPLGFVGPVHDQRMVAGHDRVDVVLVRPDGDLPHPQRPIGRIVVHRPADRPRA
jgi:hypothetical protein